MWLNINHLILAAIVVSLEIGVLALQPVGVGWHSCKPQCLPRQGHTVASGNPGLSGMADAQATTPTEPTAVAPKAP